MIAYNKTYLLCLENDMEEGMLLHIGDIEEYFECVIFKSGKYSLKYVKTGKNLWQNNTAANTRFTLLLGLVCAWKL